MSLKERKIKMDWEPIIYGIEILLALVILIGGISGGVYINSKLAYGNFQATIKDLSPEQKCLHICGFEWKGYLENYKFCIEKCDRISERTLNQCGDAK